MRLSLLLEAVKEYKYTGNPDPDITGLNYDSRKIRPGELFVAVKGNTLDGHKFIQKAIDNGAKAVLVEEGVIPPPDISVIKVSDTRREMSRLAARFYEYPFNSMNVTGVTGTSGKTTVTYMIESILVAAGEKPGVIGTVNTRFMDRITPSSVTTPESLDLMRIARDMADRGVESLVMEVSSHAIHQKRTNDLPFRTVVFTNLSRDHLDYHATLEDYFETKSRLFKNLPMMVNGKKSCAVINMDDPKGRELCKLTKAFILTYGLNGAWDIRAENIRADLNGLSAELITPYGSTALRSPLLGEINIYNILAAAGAALASGVSPDKISEGIASLMSVPGRLERVPNRAGLSIIVDYSHKPDALLKVLTS
ncbi:MAG: UDP-N-acetylmuramoyl-L-alanyl-D-glutamate--2,6-diaminopimelate ligase, partial [Deltaproteobacteria bacterium]|nr:UDP-N-acetylmuramoyl-L-alanyl-D-glutamate--2,6-diaminopimelate ligase [Deltaproteobacteria bacterium]